MAELSINIAVGLMAILYFGVLSPNMLGWCASDRWRLSGNDAENTDESGKSDLGKTTIRQ